MKTIIKYVKALVFLAGILFVGNALGWPLCGQLLGGLEVGLEKVVVWVS